MTQQELVLSAEFFLRILTAAVCGIVIGYERENRNKEAGIRTHAIVALGRRPDRDCVKIWIF